MWLQLSCLPANFLQVEVTYWLLKFELSDNSSQIVVNEVNDQSARYSTDHSL